MAKGVMSVDVDARSYRNTVKLLNQLPKDVQEQVRVHAQDIAIMMKQELEHQARTSPTPQARLVAKSMKTPKDRFPKVTIGGPLKVGRPYKSRGGGRKRAPAGALLWGSEHGSRGGTDRRGRNYTRRYVAGHNDKGYWIAPALKRVLPIARDEYEKIINSVIGRASDG